MEVEELGRKRSAYFLAIVLVLDLEAELLEVLVLGGVVVYVFGRLLSEAKRKRKVSEARPRRGRWY